jgi:hypothetical protein
MAWTILSHSERSKTMEKSDGLYAEQIAAYWIKRGFNVRPRLAVRAEDGASHTAIVTDTINGLPRGFKKADLYKINRDEAREW